MAAKKAVRKKKVASKQLVTMADLELQMAEEAGKDAERTGGSGGDGNSISISGGSFTFKEADLGEELDVVIIDFVNLSEWYDRPFSKDDNTVAACMATNYESPKGMVPSHNCPVPQSDSCDECELSEWDSGPNGSKACKEKRKLMVIAKDELDSPVESMEIAFIKVPSMSVKTFDKYIKGLEKVSKKPCYGVVTTITFDEDFDYPNLLFKPDEVLQDISHIIKVRELRELYHEDLMEEPDFSAYEEPPKQKVRKGKKKASKKKGRSKLSN